MPWYEFVEDIKPAGFPQNTFNKTLYILVATELQFLKHKRDCISSTACDTTKYFHQLLLMH